MDSSLINLDVDPYPDFSKECGSVIYSNSVADADPGSGAFLTPGSGMGKKSGSGIRDLDPDSG